MALATLTDVKLHLGITVDTYDAQLYLWMNAAIAAIKAACKGFDFETTTRTDYYQPENETLIARFRPIQSITSIYEDAGAAWGQSSNAFGADTLLTEGEDYALVKDGSGINGEISLSGLVMRIGRSWAQTSRPISLAQSMSGTMMRRVVPAMGAVKMTYVSGFLAVPSDVLLAVCFEVDAIRNKKGKGGGTVQSEGLGEYNYSLANVDNAAHAYGFFQSPATSSLLAPYLPSGLVI